VTDVRRVSLVAALLWVGLHLGQALVYADEHRHPAVLLVAVAIAILIAGATLVPLVSPEPAELSLPSGLALVGAAVVMLLCVHPWLTPEGVAGFANWPTGEIGILVATLVLRDRVECGVLAALAAVVSNAVAVLTIGHDDPAGGWLPALLLAAPPLTWLFGSLGVRAVLRRDLLLREAYVQRAFGFADEERLRAAVTSADTARRRELLGRIEPLLERVVVQGATPSLRAEASASAQDLRDTLKARSLLTRALRDTIAAARARGVRVTVSSDLDRHDEHDQDDGTAWLLHATRGVLESVLLQVGSGTAVSCRTTTGPPSTVLLVRPPATHRTADVRRVLESATAAVRRAGRDVLLEEHDGEVLLELR
jgi:hypothetical protein